MVMSDPTQLEARGTITHMESPVCVRRTVVKDE